MTIALSLSMKSTTILKVAAVALLLTANVSWAGEEATESVADRAPAATASIEELEAYAISHVPVIEEDEELPLVIYSAQTFVIRD